MTNMPRFCTTCGAAPRPGGRFCAICGSPVAAKPAPAPPPQQCTGEEGPAESPVAPTSPTSLVNGKQVGTFTDSTHAAGTVGVFTSNDQPGNFHVVYEAFKATILLP